MHSLIIVLSALIAIIFLVVHLLLSMLFKRIKQLEQRVDCNLGEFYKFCQDTYRQCQHNTYSLYVLKHNPPERRYVKVCKFCKEEMFISEEKYRAIREAELEAEITNM